MNSIFSILNDHESSMEAYNELTAEYVRKMNYVVATEAINEAESENIRHSVALESLSGDIDLLNEIDSSLNGATMSTEGYRMLAVSLNAIANKYDIQPNTASVETFNELSSFSQITVSKEQVGGIFIKVLKIIGIIILVIVGAIVAFIGYIFYKVMKMLKGASASAQDLKEKIKKEEKDNGGPITHRYKKGSLKGLVGFNNLNRMEKGKLNPADIIDTTPEWVDMYKLPQFLLEASRGGLSTGEINPEKVGYEHKDLLADMRRRLKSIGAFGWVIDEDAYYKALDLVEATPEKVNLGMLKWVYTQWDDSVNDEEIEIEVFSLIELHSVIEETVAFIAKRLEVFAENVKKIKGVIVTKLKEIEAKDGDRTEEDKAVVGSIRNISKSLIFLNPIKVMGFYITASKTCLDRVVEYSPQDAAKVKASSDALIQSYNDHKKENRKVMNKLPSD